MYYFSFMEYKYTFSKLLTIMFKVILEYRKADIFHLILTFGKNLI